MSNDSNASNDSNGSSEERKMSLTSLARSIELRLAQSIDETSKAPVGSYLMMPRKWMLLVVEALRALTDCRHSAAPKWHKCSDCMIDGEPCPTCYLAWWTARHPYHVTLPELVIPARETAFRAGWEAHHSQQTDSGDSTDVHSAEAAWRRTFSHHPHHFRAAINELCAECGHPESHVYHSIVGRANAQESNLASEAAPQDTFERIVDQFLANTPPSAPEQLLRIRQKFDEKMRLKP